MLALLAESFPPALGGMETMSANFARAWAESGREVVVFADSRELPGEADFDKAQKFTVHRFAGPRPFRRWRKFRAVAEFAAKHPDVKVCADSWKSVPHSLPPQFPVFCFAHGNDMLEVRPKKEGRRSRALARANFVVANSEFTADLARKIVPDTAQVGVIHPGVGLPDSPDSTPAKAAFHRRQVAKLTNKADPLLITVARLEPRKGADSVIRALPTLKAAHPKIAHLIVGEGGDRARLEGVAKESGVSDRVFFAGYLSAPKKFAALSSASLYALPCRRSEHSVEGFGAGFLEAGLCGVASVAGREGGAAEAVLEGETGWLCEGEDEEAVCKTLVSALADAKELARRGAAAKARAESDFTWKAAARHYLDLMDKAAAN